MQALLLLDRLLYLRERGHDACLVPLFDPLLSPRSYGLVAVKRARRPPPLPRAPSPDLDAGAGGDEGGGAVNSRSRGHGGSVDLSRCGECPWSDVV